MGVLVKLLRTVSGAELADAIEKAGREIGCEVTSRKEVYYKPGSVCSQELKRTVEMKYVVTTKTTRTGILWLKSTVMPVKVITIYHDKKLFAESQTDQIELCVRKDERSYGGFFGCDLDTSDPGFNEIKPLFEKFLAALYRILKQGPQSLPSSPPPPPRPDAPWYKPDQVIIA